jgi:hypothetical protein
MPPKDLRLLRQSELEVTHLFATQTTAWGTGSTAGPRHKAEVEAGAPGSNFEPGPMMKVLGFNQDQGARIELDVPPEPQRYLRQDTR